MAMPSFALLSCWIVVGNPIRACCLQWGLEWEWEWEARRVRNAYQRHCTSSRCPDFRQNFSLYWVCDPLRGLHLHLSSSCCTVNPKLSRVSRKLDLCRGSERRVTRLHLISFALVCCSLLPVYLASPAGVLSTLCKWRTLAFIWAPSCHCEIDQFLSTFLLGYELLYLLRRVPSSCSRSSRCRQSLLQSRCQLDPAGLPVAAADDRAWMGNKRETEVLCGRQC